MKTKAVFCWSGGKDSALALYEVLRAGHYEVDCLLTTVNEHFKRISMHGVREELLMLQANAIGLPLVKVYVKEGSNEEYERNMEAVLLRLKEKGITHVIFGDIFLEDLRAYREKNLEKIGLQAVFPLWKRDTAALILSFLELNFRTITCCINDQYLGEEHTGREIDRAFIQALPSTVDPCGENGEFHTFCFDGPLFKHPVAFSTGTKVYRPLEVKTQADPATSTTTRGFWYSELVPVS